MQSSKIAEPSKSKLKKGVKWLLISSIVTIFGVGGWLFYLSNFQKKTNAVSVPIETVTTGDVENTINESGTVELGGQQNLKSPGEVTVEKVFIKVGDRVRRGQQLLELRNSQQQSTIAEQDVQIRKQELVLVRSREKVTEAQDKLALAQKELREPIKQQLDIRKEELSLARNREKVVETQAKLEAGQKELQNLQALSQKGFIAGEELQRQQATVRELESSLKNAQLDVNTKIIEIQSLNVSKQRQTEQQDKVLTAQTALKDAISEVNKETREMEKLRVDRANKIAQVQNNLVIAPIIGKVLDVKVRNGDGIKPGDVLLTLGNPAQELIKLQLGTLDAAKVKVSQKARIKVIGPDSTVFTGRVQAIHPQAITSEGGGSSFPPGGGSSSQAKVPATVQLEEATGKLIPGSQVSVEIIVQQRQNVVAVNLEAIQREAEKPFVWIRDHNGKAQKRTVALGLESATKIEVKSGLKSGEKIIIPSPDIVIEPGMAVVESGEQRELGVEPPKK